MGLTKSIWRQILIVRGHALGVEQVSVAIRILRRHPVAIVDDPFVVHPAIEPLRLLWLTQGMTAEDRRAEQRHEGREVAGLHFMSKMPCT